MARVRSGRVELRVPPTPARYLRFTQTGRSAVRDWTVRELFVYAADPDAVSTPPVADPLALARAIRAVGVRRLYADHGWASRIALADPKLHVPPANLAVDSYGFQGPESTLLPLVEWSPGSGALLEAPDVAGFVTVARASGLHFRRVDLRGLTLIVYAPPPPAPAIPASALRVSASRHEGWGQRAIDGDPRSRWTTARPQAPGDWLRVDLDESRAVRGVRLWTTKGTDWPRGIRLEGSADGETWRRLAADSRSESTVRWAGIALLRDDLHAIVLEFAPTPLKALRLTVAEGHPRYAWSVNELIVYAAD